MPFTRHPLLEHTPLREREEADEDVRFDTRAGLVVDGAQFQIAFGGAERGFGLGEPSAEGGAR